MTNKDERPPIWIGHVSLEVAKFRDSYRFMKSLGMRRVARFPGLAILELRGGTHLVLQKKKDAVPADAGFDLMVDDLDAQHAVLVEDGYEPSPIKRGRIHSTFEVTEPSGHRIKFFDSHVAGPV